MITKTTYDIVHENQIVKKMTLLADELEQLFQSFYKTDSLLSVEFLIDINKEAFRIANTVDRLMLVETGRRK